MAGRKNHILPKLLMRGFCVDSQKKAEMVYVFKNSQKPFIASLDKIGAKRDYYKLNDSTFIDDKMSSDEEHYASIINKIRSTRKTTIDDYEHLNNFTFDLYTRSNSIVKELEKSTVELVRSISSDKHSERFIELILHKTLEIRRTKLLNETIQELIAEHGLKKVSPRIPEIRERVNALIDSQNFRKSITIQLQSIFPLVKEQLSNKIGEAVKIGQLQTLTDRYIEPEKYHRFDFKWTLLNQLEKHIILGDVGPLFVSSAGTTSLLWVKGKIDAIYLPLSSTILAIGFSENHDKPIDVDQLNNASALFSSDFFIASESDEKTTRLSTTIGANNRHLQSIDSAINEWLTETSNGQRST